ncbi:MAG: pentapeptide repeat-containing protein [Geminicoccaceae bacterium]|nr:pentapeptide repeat-containing protein [Geminicoccaceae bacterium]MDW8369807.1 pentapeptide repeat-containing protein [Geminicoccaceae bacterium]
MRPDLLAPPVRAGDRIRLAAVLAVGAALQMMATAEPARAACTDLPAAGVEWRRCRMDGAALDGVDLTGARLVDTSFQRASLRGARLVRADARRARFISTDLREAVLDGADLTNADLTNADLAGASLQRTDLRRARLFRANLKGADLTGANLDGADLLHAELAGARWIDGVSICAPDSVGRCHPVPTGTGAGPAASVPSATLGQ